MCQVCDGMAVSDPDFFRGCLADSNMLKRLKESIEKTVTETNVRADDRYAMGKYQYALHLLAILNNR